MALTALLALSDPLARLAGAVDGLAWGSPSAELARLALHALSSSVALLAAALLAGLAAQGGAQAAWWTRAMGLSAGAMLLAGLGLYALLRPRA